jgi:hypothetical protein
MDANFAAELWEEAWTKGGDSAPWSRLLEHLTAEQALWRPQPERHSIWQIALHIVFWRDVLVRRAKGITIPDDELRQRNWETFADTGEPAWRLFKQQWEASCRAFIAAIRQGTIQPRRAIQLLAHDQYHAGQIMYLRAMLNLPSIEQWT